MEEQGEGSVLQLVKMEQSALVLHPGKDPALVLCQQV